MRRAAGVRSQASMANDAEGDEGPPKALGWATGQYWRGNRSAITLGGKPQGRVPRGQVAVQAEWTELIYELGSQQTYIRRRLIDGSVWKLLNSVRGLSRDALTRMRTE